MTPTNEGNVKRWRAATFALAFVLLLVLVAWVMREQSIAYATSAPRPSGVRSAERWARRSKPP